MNNEIPAATLGRPKELKIKLPVQQHLQLRAHKLMTGLTISEVVTSALDGFLDEEIEDCGDLL